MLFCVFSVCYDVHLSHLNKDYLLTYKNPLPWQIIESNKFGGTVFVLLLQSVYFFLKFSAKLCNFFQEHVRESSRVVIVS